MPTRAIAALAALALTAACLPPQEQEPAPPTKPGGAKTVVDPNDPDSGFNRAQWNHAVGLGLQAGRYGGRRLSAQRPPANVMAVRAGLTWLKNNQQQDGSWRVDDDADTSTALTGLAVLAMLGDGSTLRMGPYKSPIKKGINWLRRQQMLHEPKNGAFADATGPHMLATLAMTECYMLSQYKLIRKPAAQGLTHLQSMRHQDGGWRASAAEEASDPALTLWGTCLLGTAADAGLSPANESDAKIAGWLTGPRAHMAPDSGVLAKAPPTTRQAELAFDQRVANAFASCWIAKACSQEQRAPLIAMRTDALKHARTLPRSWSEAPGQKLSMHEWFCSSHLLVQSGEAEAVAKMTKTLAAAQVRDGEHAGSWPPIGAWGDVGGRVWTTAMAVLTMESPYRYTRFEPATPPEGQGR